MFGLLDSPSSGVTFSKHSRAQVRVSGCESSPRIAGQQARAGMALALIVGACALCGATGFDLCCVVL
jgi:hypothetical protein